MDKINKTRQLILDVSKDIILDKGYSATTFQMIADVANISKTSINYYYAKKQDISNEIIADFVTKCRDYVVNTFRCNELMHFVLTEVVFFKAILATNESRGFFYDLIRRNTTYSSPHSELQNYYLSIVYSLNLNISPRQLSVKKYSIFGAFNELAVNYLSGQLQMSEEEFIIANLSDTLAILTVPSRTAEAYIKAGMQIYENADKKEIPKF